MAANTLVLLTLTSLMSVVVALAILLVIILYIRTSRHIRTLQIEVAILVHTIDGILCIMEHDLGIDPKACPMMHNVDLSRSSKRKCCKNGVESFRGVKLSEVTTKHNLSGDTLAPRTSGGNETQDL